MTFYVKKLLVTISDMETLVDFWSAELAVDWSALSEISGISSRFILSIIMEPYTQNKTNNYIPI